MRFELGDIVYLITDKEQDPRIIIGITLRIDKSITYVLASGTTESQHFAAEISKTKNYKM
jgi:hypothetical protein